MDHIFAALRPPARRKVKEMTELIGQLQNGDHVQATFMTPRYGVFVVNGSAFYSATVKTFMVGSLFIESSLKPVDTLRMLELLPSVDRPASVDAEYSEFSSDVVRHGDVVRASFVREPHGTFTVAGVAIETNDASVTALGTWFISFQGIPGAALKSVEVLARAGNHSVLVPPRIGDWESDVVPG